VWSETKAAIIQASARRHAATSTFTSTLVVSRCVILGDLSGHAGAALKGASSRSALRIDRRSQIYRFTIHALAAFPVPPLICRGYG
jgi:hypothetical protein